MLERTADISLQRGASALCGRALSAVRDATQVDDTILHTDCEAVSVLVTREHTEISLDDLTWSAFERGHRISA